MLIRSHLSTSQIAAMIVQQEASVPVPFTGAGLKKRKEYIYFYYVEKSPANGKLSSGIPTKLAPELS